MCLRRQVGAPLRAAALAGSMLAASMPGLAGGPAAASGNAPVASARTGAAMARPVVVGSTDLPEQVVVADAYGDALRRAGFQVRLATGLGDRAAVLAAFAAGRIDLFPDYVGSLLISLDAGMTAQATRVRTALPALRAALRARGATVLEPAPAVDDNAFAVTPALARAEHLSTLSSLRGHARQLVLGGPPACPSSPTCLPGLARVYGLHFKAFVALDDGGPVSVEAVETGRVQVVELFSSQGSIQSHGLVALGDDRHLQPADHVVPVIRAGRDTPPVARVLDGLSRDLTTDSLAVLNLEVSTGLRAPEAAAAAWVARLGRG